jgi:arylsulfatase A
MTMDILPTVLDILKIHIPPEDSPNFIDGISILPLLLKGDNLIPRTLFWRFRNSKAARQGPWKLVIQDDSVNLFNLDHDIGETTNLKAEHPILVNELVKKLVDWEKSVDY